MLYSHVKIWYNFEFICYISHAFEILFKKWSLSWAVVGHTTKPIWASRPIGSSSPNTPANIYYLTPFPILETLIAPPPHRLHSATPPAFPLPPLDLVHIEPPPLSSSLPAVAHPLHPLPPSSHPPPSPLSLPATGRRPRKCREARRRSGGTLSGHGSVTEEE
jgi:hypothetical protein